MIFSRSHALQNCAALAVIFVTGIALYGHTLQAPWYLDDVYAILENPVVRDLDLATRRLLTPRGIPYWTFSLNHHLGGFDLAGFHAVNIAIHLLTSCLVFLILKRAFPLFSWLPLACALIFVAHPLQTQAVTYIVQRMTSLSALFLFLSLYFYLRAREAFHREGRLTAPDHLLFYLLALLAGAAAAYSKENAAILPLLLILFDRYFLPRSFGWRGLIAYVTPFLLVPSWLAFRMVLLPVSGGKELASLGSVQKLAAFDNMSPLHYLFTEFSVLWIYIRLLFLPYGQTLDYSYPIINALFTIKNFIAFSGLSVLGALSYSLRNRQPLISIGIAWFFAALLVESSVIILDPIFEHRLYIPLFGFSLVIAGIAGYLKSNVAKLFLFSLIMIFSMTTFVRNNVWNNKIEFLESNLRSAPHSERVMLGLAVSYIDHDRIKEAEDLLHKAIETNPFYLESYIDLSKIYISQGRLFEANKLIANGLKINPSNKKLLNNLCSLYSTQGKYLQARSCLESVLRLDNNFSSAHTNMGVSLAGEGRWDEAVPHYLTAIKLLPDNHIARYNLGVAFYNLGKVDDALQEFRLTANLAPRDKEALFNLGILSLEKGDRVTAVESLSRLSKLDPGLASKLDRALSAAEK